MARTDDVEQHRLAAVRRYDVLDTPPDQAFDRICALAARTCNAPIAIVTIVDTGRIWFKARHGVDVPQIDRDPGLCASAILHDGPWIVEDATTDPRALANPLVAGEFGLQFYLGIPLRTADGHNLGTLCVLDTEPRAATEREVQDLTDLAAVVVDELELRLASSRTVTLESELRRQAEELAGILQTSLVPEQLPELEGVELAARYVPANRERVGGDFYDAFETHDGYGLLVGDVSGHGPKTAALASNARHCLRTLMASTDWPPSRVLAELNTDLLRAQADDNRRHCTVALVRCQPKDSGLVTTVALGGHPSPRVLRADGSVEVAGSPGTLVGWLPGASCTDAYLHLGPGDALVLYTDGLIEAGGSGTRFDEQCLDATLATLGGASAVDIADTLVAAVTRSTDSAPRDDIALLVARSPDIPKPSVPSRRA